MAEYTYGIYATVTGAPRLPMFPSGGTWQRVLGSAAGEQSHTFPLADGDPGRYLDPATWRAETKGWDRTLVVLDDGVPVYAGIIIEKPYDYDNNVLTLRHVDIWTIFKDRFPFGVGSYHGGTFEVSGLSWRAIAGRIVQAATSGPRPIYALPIVLSNLSEAGPHSLKINNFNFQTAYAALQEIQAKDGGPDIDFQPRLTAAGNLEYLMRVGSPASPKLTGPMVEFNMAASRRPLTGVVETESARNQITGMFVDGEGSEVDMVVGGLPVGAEPPPQISVARDQRTSSKSSKTEADASGVAIARTAVLIAPTLQSDVAYVVDPDVANVRDLVLGGVWRRHYSGDFILEDGYRDSRLMSLSGDTSRTVKPVLQQIGGA